MNDLTETIRDALTSEAAVKMIGRRMTALLSSEGSKEGALLVLPIKDRAPDVPLRSSFTRLIPWAETDRYRLQAVQHENGLELLLTYD